MEQKKASNKALKYIVCSFIIIVIFVMTYTKVHALNENINTNEIEQDEVVPLKPQLRDELLELKLNFINSDINDSNVDDEVTTIDEYIIKYDKELNFFSKIFGYDIEVIKEDIIKRNEYNEANEMNLANLYDEDGNLLIFPNPLYGIVEYFYKIMNTNEIVREKRLISYSGSKEYIENLIIYYSKIYTNVDTSIALSIGAAESGYYEVKYMLSMNNVYGGMGTNGLIRHENIELGVLNYIRLLSLNYFGKGLTTIPEIGYVYCPTINENGIKVASPHWINLVNTAKLKYDSYEYNTTIDDIII